MMNKVNEFITDSLRTFVFFLLSAFLAIINVLIELGRIAKWLTANYIIPFLTSLAQDLNHFYYIFVYELFYLLSSVFVNFSKLSSFLSNFFLDRAGEISRKRGW